MAYVIGVDAGGTATKAAAYDLETGRTLAAGQDGSGNVVPDFEKAYDHIRGTIAQVTVPGEAPAWIYVGAAGVVTSGLTGELEARLSRDFFCRARAVSDARLALDGALKGRDGALLISGTGSAVQVRRGKESYLIGGWGDRVGDEGSAFDMVRQAIHQMTEADDLGEAEHPLSAAIRRHFGTQSARDTVRYIMGVSKGKFASAASVVDALAQGGDRDAVAVEREAARSLAGFVAIAARRAKLPAGFPLAFQGSVLKNSVTMVQFLQDALREAGVVCRIQPFESELTRGAWYVYRAEKEQKQ